MSLKPVHKGIEVRMPATAKQDAGKRRPSAESVFCRKISLKSPIGAALMGKKVGEITEAQTPSGILRLRVDSSDHLSSHSGWAGSSAMRASSNDNPNASATPSPYVGSALKQ